MAYFCIFLTVIFTAVGQLLVKHATNERLGPFPGLTSDGLIYLVRALLDVYVIAGFVLAFLASLTWIMAVSRLQLSFAYPFTILAFVIVMVASAWLFREPLPPLRVLGVVVISLGVFLVSRS